MVQKGHNLACPWRRGDSLLNSAQTLLDNWFPTLHFILGRALKDHLGSSFQQSYWESGLPSGPGGKEPTCQCWRHKRPGSDPWVGKIPWRRQWLPTPVLLPGESPWTEEPGKLQFMKSQRIRHYWSNLAHKHRCTSVYRGLDFREVWAKSDDWKSWDYRGSLKP